MGLLLLGGLPVRAQTQTPDPSDTTYVRFAIYEGSTFFGNIDVQMLTKEAPLNVANFMGYVNAGNYNNSFIHRSIPGFIVQGGEYNFVSGTPTPIVSSPPTVAGEHNADNPLAFSNVRGTIAMALSAGTDTTAQYDTATTSWFFNLVDNNNASADNNLDQSAGGGPFTVFGVIANASSLGVMDAIAAVQTFNFGGDLANLPLVDYTTTDYDNNVSPFLSDFIYVNSITTFSPTNFTTWQAAFQSDPNAATDELPAATPQNDSTPNLLKYLCDVPADTSMSAASRAKLPTVSKTTISGTTYLTLTWHQRPNLVGVYATVLTSTDLQMWAAPTNDITTQTATTDGSNDVIMQVQVPALTTGTQFIRLSVTQ